MTTTAHEDQFTAGTQTIQPVLQPYSTEAILRRNIADAEKEMQRQAERAESYAETLRSLASYVGAGGYNADVVDADVFGAKIRWGIDEIMARTEKAEAELARLAQQEPIKYLYRVTDCFGHDVLRDDPRDATITETIPLYAAPVPAPAVPNEISLGKGEFVIWPVKIGGVHGLAFVKTNDPQAVGAFHAEPEDGQIELGAGDSVIHFGNAESAMVLAERLQYVIALLQSAEPNNNAAADRLLEGGE